LSDLVTLAERFIRASAEVENIRRAMLSALTNGGGETPKAPFSHARQRGGRASQSKHPAAARAAAEEEKILVLLKDQPGLRGSEIARTLDCKANTTAQRLQRMESRGVIERLDGKDAGWTASAAAG
jgi:hypothetical protein